MKNKRLLHPKEAANELDVSTKTIHRWDEAGKLQTVRTVGNQRRIPIEEIVRLRKQREHAVERCVLYARVSSVRQEQGGSLVRFGFRYLEQAFSWKHVRLEVLDPPHHQRLCKLSRLRAAF